MDMQFNNKLALVTGSTAGIGLAIGSTLAGEGATVVINGRSQKARSRSCQENPKEATSSQTAGIRR